MTKFEDCRTCVQSALIDLKIALGGHMCHESQADGKQQNEKRKK